MRGATESPSCAFHLAATHNHTLVNATSARLKADLSLSHTVPQPPQPHAHAPLHRLCSSGLAGTPTERPQSWLWGQRDGTQPAPGAVLAIQQGSTQRCPRWQVLTYGCRRGWLGTVVAVHIVGMLTNPTQQGSSTPAYPFNVMSPPVFMQPHTHAAHICTYINTHTNYLTTNRVYSLEWEI